MCDRMPTIEASAPRVAMIWGRRASTPQRRSLVSGTLQLVRSIELMQQQQQHERRTEHRDDTVMDRWKQKQKSTGLPYDDSVTQHTHK
mmetsp:Transcript_43383/g.48289  ORF Transcript_43383/g.48289 Transcript_43383/m.48289 type:complete len:88 (-) Transcript_43383:570-833(-)